MNKLQKEILKVLRLLKIEHDAEGFYFDRANLLASDYGLLLAEKKSLVNDLNKVLNSKAYKLGERLASPVRKIAKYRRNE